MDGWVLTKRESVLAKAVNTMPVPHQKGDDMKRKKRAAKRTQRKTQLGVQKLETRKLMAGDVAMIDNVVSLTGTELNDVAEIYTEGDSVNVRLTTYDTQGALVSEQIDSFARAEIDAIIFQAGDGDDVFINDTDIDSITRSGGGNDTVIGGEGNDILAAGTGDDLILGGGGLDLILAGPGDNVVITGAPVAQTPATDETSTDETTAEEAVAEENIAEDTVADDAIVEDTVSDETAVADTVAEETVAEDTAVEEAAVEESAAEEIAAEDTAVEETATDETVAEDVSAVETATDESATEETVAEENTACL